MWNDNPEIHEKCVSDIQKVASIPDSEARYRLALEFICSGVALYPENTKLPEWACTVAMAALHPEIFNRQ